MCTKKLVKTSNLSKKMITSLNSEQDIFKYLRKHFWDYSLVPKECLTEQVLLYITNNVNVSRLSTAFKNIPVELKSSKVCLSTLDRKFHNLKLTIKIIKLIPNSYLIGKCPVDITDPDSL